MNAILDLQVLTPQPDSEELDGAIGQSSTIWFCKTTIK
jgi:hypothetical protein